MTMKLRKLLNCSLVVFWCLIFSFAIVGVFADDTQENFEELPQRGLFEEHEFDVLLDYKLPEEEDYLRVAQEGSVRAKEQKKTKYLGQFRMTAYCSCAQCNGSWASKSKDKYGIPITVGAAGVRLREGVSIATDPKVIPLGSKVLINGREYIAQDTGGAIKGKRIDMYFNFHDGLAAHGVKQVDVYLISDN